MTRSGVTTARCGDATGIVRGFRSLSDTIPRTSRRRPTVAIVGSGIELDDRGSHELKGVPDAWQLFAVAEQPGT
jgi:hypothetical protein